VALSLSKRSRCCPVRVLLCACVRACVRVVETERCERAGTEAPPLLLPRRRPPGPRACVRARGRACVRVGREAARGNVAPPHLPTAPSRRVARPHAPRHRVQPRARAHCPPAVVHEPERKHGARQAHLETLRSRSPTGSACSTLNRTPNLAAPPGLAQCTRRHMYTPSLSLPVCLPVRLSACLPAYLSVRLSVCLSAPACLGPHHALEPYLTFKPHTQPALDPTWTPLGPHLDPVNRFFGPFLQPAQGLTVLKIYFPLTVSPDIEVI
jgi:hypothetical protein